MRKFFIAIVALLVLYFAVRFAGSKIIESQMKLYTPISDNSPVVQLAVIPTNTNHKWKVEIFSYDNSGKLARHPQIFLEPCDHWILTANIISIPSWLALAVPSGWYVLKELEGSHCYNQHGNLTSSMNRIKLDRSTASMTGGQFLNLVSSKPVASASIHPDGITYNVSITPTSLSVKPKS